MKLRNYYCLFLALTSFGIFAQSNILNANIPDKIGVTDVDQKQSDMDSFLDYEFVDDRDILWSKIVYEKIDLNERLNFPLLFPIDDKLYDETRKSLWRVLRENIINGNITEIYTNFNDNFLKQNKMKPVDSINSKTGVVDYDPKTGKPIGSGFLRKVQSRIMINGKDKGEALLSSANISSYIIKGIWYFDKRRGELDYRLLGIMPVGKDINNEKAEDDEPVDDSTGEVDRTSEEWKTWNSVQTETELFWIWYPSIRKFLHVEKVFNDTSNANQISFDQLLISKGLALIFLKRIICTEIEKLKIIKPMV